MNADEQRVLTKAQRLTSWNSQKLYYCIGKNHQRRWTVKRGEVYFVDLGENVGSEECKIRPVVVLQSDAYNFRSPVFTAAIISSSPVTIRDIQVSIVGTYPYTDSKGVARNLCGAVDLGQIKTVAKERIVSSKVCELKLEIKEIDRKLLNIFGLTTMITARDNTISSLMGKIEYLKTSEK